MATKNYILTILKYALVAFIGDYVYLHVLHLLGILYDHEGLILGYLSLVVLCVAFYLCLHELNTRRFNNRTPIVPLLLGGLLLSVMATGLYLLLYNMELHILHTYPHNELLEMERTDMLNENVSPEAIETELQKIREHYFTFKAQWGVMKWYLKWGLLFTAVFILFFKLKQYIKLKKMKTLLLSAAYFFAYQLVWAQSPFYEVKTSTAAYNEITDPTWIEDNPDFDYQVPSLPGFSFFNKEFGTSIFVLKDGWILTCGPTNCFSMSPFLAYRGLYARASGSSMSAIGSVEPNGDTIIKIQWKNMGLSGNDSGDYANFQLWMYKKSQTIEFRYGPSRVTDTAAFKGYSGPAVDIMLYDTGYSQVLEVHKLVHDPMNPKDTADYVGIYSQLSGPPANSTVYTFSRRSAASVKENAVNKLLVYPNPVTANTLSVNTKTAWVNPRFSIVNTLGQVIQLENITSSNTGYEVTLPEGLQNGIYFMKITDAESTVYWTKIQVAR